MAGDDMLGKIVGARSVRSCDGRKSYDNRDILLEIFVTEIFISFIK